MTYGLLIYDKKIFAYFLTLGSPSSYMTLQPLPSECPYTVYIRKFIFIFYHLHGPEGEYVLLVEEDPCLVAVLDPLHGVQEQGRPLVRHLAANIFSS
jgi:hypothetical protein